MTSVPAEEFAQLSAPKLRLMEVKHLFEQFKSARNADINHGLFLLTVYFDSLLFCLISIEEMVDPQTRDKLQSLGSFLFFKALRNITTHHSVLSGVKGKFERPIARIVSVGVGYEMDLSEQFFLAPDKLERIFDAILIERSREQRTIEAARSYLSTIKSSGNIIMVTDLVHTVISEVEPHIA